MEKAFAYVRVSGQSQIKGDGFPRQLLAIKTYAKAHGISLVKEYREEGITGSKDTLDRPAWSQMMAALHANGVKTIIIEKLDRLARDLMVQETALADLHKSGFTLISVAEPDLMATDPTRILMRQLMGAVAQYDKSQIVLKLRGARERMKAETGRCEGVKPFGFNPVEQAIVGRIKALQASGLSMRAIAKQLNEEGIPTRSGGLWFDAVIGRILDPQMRLKTGARAKAKADAGVKPL